MKLLDMETLEYEQFEVRDKLPPALPELYPSQNSLDPRIDVVRYYLEENLDALEPTIDQFHTLAKIVLTLHGQSRSFFAICNAQVH